MAKTLLKLNVGDKVRDPQSRCLGAPIAWQVADILHQGYPGGSVTLCTQYQVALYAFDGSETGSDNADRQVQGNNRYSLSNVRRWLNCEKLSGWYEAAHDTDAPPDAGKVSANSYTQAPGFMSGLSEDFIKAAQPTALITAKSSADGSGSETVTDLFFVPSNTEVGVANQGGVAEGVRLALFGNDAQRQRAASAAAVANSTYEDNPLPETQSWPWRTRTPVVNTAGQVCTVLSSGQGNVSFPANQGGNIGMLVCCNLSGSTRVSDSPDAEGYYTVLFEEEPPKKAGDLLVGDLLRVHLGGKEKLAAVVHQGKPSALYGGDSDGTWVMPLEGEGVESSAPELYSNSLYGKLNQKYASLLDLALRPYVKTVRLPVLNNANNQIISGESGLEARCFLFSAIETAVQSTYKDGVGLSFFTGAGAAQRRICRIDDTPVDWFTRTLYYSSNYRKYYVQKTAALGNHTKTDALTAGIRFGFVLDKDMPLQDGPAPDGSWAPLVERGTASLSDLSVYDRVKDPNTRYLGKPIVWQIADKEHEGHPAGSVAVISDRILCAKPFDATEGGYATGNSRYSYSNLRQWLNSTAGPGQWYMPMHAGDRPPTAANVYASFGNAYDQEAGFMNGFSGPMREALLPVPVTVDVGNGSTATELLRDRLCLVSPSEFGVGDMPTAEGTLLEIFRNGWNRERCFTEEGLAANTSTSKPADTATPWRFWMRASYATNYQVFESNGASYTYEPPSYGQAGVLPLGALPGDVMVSNMQDADGSFILVFNERPDAPQIAELEDGCRVETDFYLPFLPAPDAEGDVQVFHAEITPDPSFTSGVVRFNTGLEKWDGEGWAPAQSADNSDVGHLFRLPITGQPLNADLYARVGTCDEEGSSYAAYSPAVALHTGTTLEFKTIITARDKRPRYVFPLFSAMIDPEAALQVLACNNAFDPAPAWEDCTEAFQKGETHPFANQEKTAESWGVQLHVTVRAQKATGEISVRAVGLGLS